MGSRYTFMEKGGCRGSAAGTWPRGPDVEKALSPLFIHQEAEAQGRSASSPHGAVALRPASLLLTDSQEASSFQEPPTPGCMHPIHPPPTGGPRSLTIWGRVIALPEPSLFGGTMTPEAWGKSFVQSYCPKWRVTDHSSLHWCLSAPFPQATPLPASHQSHLESQQGAVWSRGKGQGALDWISTLCHLGHLGLDLNHLGQVTKPL